jgi:hypothetical protein
VARGKRPASRRPVFLPGARQNVCGATMPCAGQERSRLQLCVPPVGCSTTLIQILAWTLTGEGRGVAQVDMPRGDARGAHWGSAGGLGFVGAPGACQGEREGCSGADAAVLVCFGQQREERAEMHPCGMSKRGR